MDSSRAERCWLCSAVLEGSPSGYCRCQDKN
jgi:hypothetical protein